MRATARRPIRSSAGDSLLARFFAPPESSASCSEASDSRFHRDFTSVPTLGRGGKKKSAPKPASQPASQQASQPASQTASQPASAPATQPAAGPKLSKKTVIAPWPQTCGEYKWPILWTLDKKTDKKGWIIQHLELDYQVTTCGDTPRTLQSPDPGWFPYWEAWPVDPGSTLTVWGDRGEVDDDTFEWGLNEKTKGYFKVTGTAEFYDGLTLPHTFVIRGPPRRTISR